MQGEAERPTVEARAIVLSRAIRLGALGETLLDIAIPLRQ
jgi:hypothetical protein